MQHWVDQNGVRIVRTPTGIGVVSSDAPPKPPRELIIEVEYAGKLLKLDVINSYSPWRDCYDDLNMLACGIRVKDGPVVLAELPSPNAIMPFMVLQGEQHHITENYVSIPPALIITDERGDVWTLGLRKAEYGQGPRGEFSFNVLRNGLDANEIASRIERRGGKVRVFTKHGWKTWNGKDFF